MFKTCDRFRGQHWLPSILQNIEASEVQELRWQKGSAQFEVTTAEHRSHIDSHSDTHN